MKFIQPYYMIRFWFITTICLLDIIVHAIPNDLCSDALPLTVGIPIVVNRSDATIDTDGVPNDCNGVYPYHKGVWYKVVGSGQRLVVRSCDASYNSNSAISVYKGECGPTTLQCVSAAWSLCDSERFIFEAELGTTYYLLFQPYYDLPTELSIFESPSVPNDLCVNAAPFTLESTIMVNTTYATSDEGDVSEICGVGPSSPSISGVWYTFTGTGDRLVARSCGNVNSYRSLSVYTGSCGQSTLECVGGTTNTCDRERFIFQTTLGTTYYLLFTSQYPYQYDEIADLSIFTPVPDENDFCVDATLFPIGSTVVVNSTYATIDTGRIPDDCNGVHPYFPGVWYKVVGSGQRLVALSCDASLYSSYSAISVYKGECGPTTLQCVLAAWSLCDSERFIFDAELGTTYYLLFQPYYDLPTELSIFESPSVPNDLCVDAAPFTLESTIMVNTTYATSDEGDVSEICGVGPSSPSTSGVWYTFTGTGDRLVARSCGNVNSYRSLSVYTGSCGQSTLECVGGTINTCGRERFIFQTILGTTYYLLFASQYPYQYDEIADLSIFTPVPDENDFCVDATLFPIGSTVVVNSTYATIDTGSVPDDCNGVFPYYPGVWYKVVGSGQRLVVRSCDASLYISYSAISVYKGECGPTTLQCVLAAWSLCDSERFIFDAEQGTTYFLLYQPYYDVPEELSIFESPSVPNDLCVNAAPFALESTIIVNTTYATSDERDVSDMCIADMTSYPGVWYTFTGTGNRLVARSCGYLYSFRSLSVYTGSCGQSKLECVGGTTNTCGRDRFIFQTTLGTTYYLLLVSAYSYLNDEIVDLSIFTPVPDENDFCVDATLFPIGSSIVVNTTYATIDTGNVPNYCNGVYPYYPGVWYKVKGTGQYFDVRSCDSGLSGSHGAISVYKGTCSPSKLQCISATWDLCESEEFVIKTVLGSDYYILVQPHNEIPPMELSIYVSASSPSQEPSISPTIYPSMTPSISPTMAPTNEPCGLFGNSIFCPLTFRGIFGRWIRKLLGLPE